MLALLAIAIVQPLQMSPETVAGRFNWTQGAIGWCALPLLLETSLFRGAVVLVGLWCAGAGAEIIRAPEAATLLNVGARHGEHSWCPIVCPLVQ